MFIKSTPEDFRLLEVDVTQPLGMEGSPAEEESKNDSG